MAVVLIACGAAALVIGMWRSYALAREALAPLVRDGEPTRTTVEAGEPVHRRSRVRRFVRRAVLSTAWLAVTLYGLFLVSVGMALP
jgi:hypothetical protein